MRSGSNGSPTAPRRRFAPALWLGILLALVVPALVGMMIVVMALRNIPSPAAQPAALLATPAFATSPAAAFATTAPPTPVAVASLDTPTFTTTSVAGTVEVTATQPAATASALPTSTPVSTHTALPSVTPAASATSIPTQIIAPSRTPEPTAPVVTATPYLLGPWSVSGTRGYFDASRGQYRVVGEVTNTSAEALQLVEISGRFLDAAGQVIATEAQVSDFWPQAVVPAGGRVPFELLVGGINAAGAYTLTVESAETEAVIRTDFAITISSAGVEADRYCVAGQVQNPGPRLRERLTLIAVLYDAAGLVVNFREHVIATPEQLQPFTGVQSLRFRICAPAPFDGVTRYTVSAFGQ